MEQIDLMLLHNNFVREKRLAKKSEETLKSYKINFNVFYNFLTYKKLEEINKSTILAFFEYLNERKRLIGKGNEVCGVCANTIITYRNRLSPFFKWLEQNDYIEENPFEKIELPKKEENDKEKFLHKEQMEKIFTAVTLNINWRNNLLRKRNLAIFYTLFYTGVRRGELFALKISDVDLENKVIHIAAQTSKSKKNRQIPISDRLYLILEDYLSCRKKFNSPYLFVSEKDKKFTWSGLKRIVSKVEKVVGFKFHLHQFRHSFAVNTLNMISDVYVVQKLLGHSRITTTALYLTCVPEEKKKTAVNALSFDDLL